MGGSICLIKKKAPSEVGLDSARRRRHRATPASLRGSISRMSSDAVQALENRCPCISCSPARARCAAARRFSTPSAVVAMWKLLARPATRGRWPRIPPIRTGWMNEPSILICRREFLQVAQRRVAGAEIVLAMRTPRRRIGERAKRRLGIVEQDRFGDSSSSRSGGRPELASAGHDFDEVLVAEL